MEPRIIKNLFDKKTHSFIMKEISLTPNNEISWDGQRSRTTSVYNRYSKFANLLLPTARKIFNDDSILPSYSLWARYMGAGGFLERHKDSNACTYTIDYCINQFEPWTLVVENKEYILETNDALCFMGEDQEHWRKPWKPGNVVDMMFFHYVRPDHWWYTGDGGPYQFDVTTQSDMMI